MSMGSSTMPMLHLWIAFMHFNCVLIHHTLIDSIMYMCELGHHNINNEAHIVWGLM